MRKTPVLTQRARVRQTIDNVLADSLRMAIMTTANVLGSVVLICIFLPYFLIAVVVLLFGYFWLQSFYRRSAREIKRIDALLRSVLYSHFSESLSGLSTIRAYDVVAAFVAENRHYMDLESRALQLTVVAQRWLAIRLDSLGAILSFVVGLLCVIGVNGISPAQVGLVLSFCITREQAPSRSRSDPAETSPTDQSRNSSGWSPGRRPKSRPI